MALNIRRFQPGQDAPGWAGLREGRGYRNAEDEPQGERLIAYEDELPLARLALQGAPVMRGLDPPTGLISHYESSDFFAGVALLEEACRRLHGQGKGLALGPMHGSTWKRYRFALPPASESEQGPPFLGEPENPPQYVSEWEAAGFRARELYGSWTIRLSDLDKAQQDGAKAAKALGAGLKPLDLGNYESELSALYDEAREAFADNVLYSPISESEFHALYLPLKPLLQPGLVWLVKSASGKVLGHVLAWIEGPRVILKNLAVRPAERGGRLGWRLIQMIHAEAARRGISEVVHALAHEDNSSSSINRVYGKDCSCLRRYALYERKLP